MHEGMLNVRVAALHLVEVVVKRSLALADQLLGAAGKLIWSSGSFLVRREGPLGPLPGSKPGCCVTGLGCPWSRVLARGRAGPGAVGGITFPGLLPLPLDVGAWPALVL